LKGVGAFWLLQCKIISYQFYQQVYWLFPLLIPLVGIGMFVLFYSMSTLNYCGDSCILPYKDGFSLWHKYLCYLLDIYPING
jgi:hypothetical protein